MPTYPYPTAVIRRNGNTPRYSRRELIEREEHEVRVEHTASIEAPDCLTDSQKEKFERYAELLRRVGIMTELDADCLSRYVIANDNYMELMTLAGQTADIDEKSRLINMADKMFSEAHKCATALGLTAASRCRLTVTPEQEEADEL